MLLLAAAFASQAYGERRRRPAPAPPEQPVPQSPQIASDMAEVQWGWGHKQLLTHYTKAMRELYRPILAKAGGAVEEDRLRREMEARIERIRKSYVEFTGQRTGWDASLIRDQYTHNNGEALVEVQELRAGGASPRYTDYFFFINDHLWKRYRAFNQDQFAGLGFDEASQVFERRYGKARPVTASGATGKRLVGLEWQDETTLLRAVDNTHFYGVLCLVYTERATERRIDQLRTNQPVKASGMNPLLEVLEQGAPGDSHADVVEHLTGKRYKTAEPRPGVKGSGGASKSGPASGKATGATIFDAPEREAPSKGRDPLLDLDI